MSRPQLIDRPTVLTLRIPASVVEAVDRWAEARGITRNRAGLVLLQRALMPPQSGGYNPQTGEFET